MNVSKNQKLTRKLIALRDRLIQCSAADALDSSNMQDTARCINGAILAVNAALETLTTNDRKQLLRALDGATKQLGSVLYERMTPDLVHLVDERRIKLSRQP